LKPLPPSGISNAFCGIIWHYHVLEPTMFYYFLGVKRETIAKFAGISFVSFIPLANGIVF